MRFGSSGDFDLILNGLFCLELGLEFRLLLFSLDVGLEFLLEFILDPPRELLLLDLFLRCTISLLFDLESCLNFSRDCAWFNLRGLCLHLK